MGEVWTQIAGGVGAANRMTVNTRRAEKDLLTLEGEGFGGDRCRTLLLREPLRKISCFYGNDKQRHIRVLDAAEFRALSSIFAYTIGLKNQRVCVSGNR